MKAYSKYITQGALMLATYSVSYWESLCQ